MSEPKQVPEEVKKEAANLEMERLQDQLNEGSVLIHELMMRSNVDGIVGTILTGALVEISEIKGSPPIQVARTIAKRALEDGTKIVRKFYEENYGPLPDEAVPPTGDDSGTAEHEAKHIPGRTD